MDKYIGKRLGGRYDIKELIGVGGMANVYKAVDIIENRIVAVKILKEEYLSNDEFLRRFRNESKAIALLSHPNIVKIYDVSLGDGIQYLVMEYVDGITLKEYIEQQHVLKWKEAVHFTVQILRALQHAHDKGIVHRDIKPHNIMLLQDGTIKVMDFGIARFARDDGRTMTDKAIGSVHYISPEQARGDVTDEKSDIYSVGVMLFEMLTGKLPFDSDSAVSVALMQMQAVPKMPRQLNETIPEGLEEITVRAMQKDPAQRYQSAAEMLRDIDEFKRNPSIVFEYKYFDDEEKTKYFDAVDNKAGSVNNIEDEDDDDEEEEEKKSKVIPILLAVASAFVVFVIIFVVVLMFNGSSVEEYTVPRVIGMSYQELINDPQYSYFKFVEETTETNDEYAKGVIFAQDPEPGSKRKEGYTIKVRVSAGKQMVNVPDVSNYTETEATDILKNNGFLVKTTKTSDPTVEKGNVVKTQPAAHEQAEKGSTVIVIISTGPAANPKEVPNVVNSTYASAKNQLQANGFVVDEANLVYVNSNLPKDTVVSQSPEGGTMAEEGQTIILTLSNGEVAKKQATFNVQLPSGLVGQQVFNIYDSGSNMVATKTAQLSLGSFEVTLEGAGTNEKYSVLLEDGTLYASYTINFDTGTVTEVERHEDVLIPDVSSEEVSSESGEPDEGDDSDSSREEDIRDRE